MPMPMPLAGLKIRKSHDHDGKRNHGEQRPKDGAFAEGFEERLAVQHKMRGTGGDKNDTSQLMNPIDEMRFEVKK